MATTMVKLAAENAKLKAENAKLKAEAEASKAEAAEANKNLVEQSEQVWSLAFSEMDKLEAKLKAEAEAKAAALKENAAVWEHQANEITQFYRDEYRRRLEFTEENEQLKSQILLFRKVHELTEEKEKSMRILLDEARCKAKTCVGLGDDEDPNDFLCAIMHQTMEDPVICADGHSYDRAAISKWLSSHATSPKTGLPLEHINLIPNHTLRGSIEKFCEQRKKEELLYSQLFDDERESYEHMCYYTYELEKEITALTCYVSWLRKELVEAGFDPDKRLASARAAHS